MRSIFDSVKVVYDISPRISPQIGVFPGDTQFQRRVAMDMQRGDHLTLSSIATTLHLGAHADAPNHYLQSGSDIANRDLRLYFGSCLVVRAKTHGRGRVSVKQIRDRLTGQNIPRVLIATESFPDPDRWNSDFAGLEPELIDLLASHGVRLVGIDTPSVDLEDSKDLPAHAALARNNMAVLEGLCLQSVPEGAYELMALPLRLAEADASPVRAVLLK